MGLNCCFQLKIQSGCAVKDLDALVNKTPREVEILAVFSPHCISLD